MKLRNLISDTIGLVCLLALCLLPLGLYKTETGLGWFWPGVGGYHIETNDNQ